MKTLGIVMACAGALVAAGAVETLYFYGRTMKRKKADVGRTVKMAGTDWSQYSGFCRSERHICWSSLTRTCIRHPLMG